MSFRFSSGMRCTPRRSLCKLRRRYRPQRRVAGRARSVLQRRRQGAPRIPIRISYSISLAMVILSVVGSISVYARTPHKVNTAPKNTSGRTGKPPWAYSAPCARDIRRWRSLNELRSSSSRRGQTAAGKTRCKLWWERQSNSDCRIRVFGGVQILICR